MSIMQKSNMYLTEKLQNQFSSSRKEHSFILQWIRMNVRRPPNWLVKKPDTFHSIWASKRVSVTLQTKMVTEQHTYGSTFGQKIVLWTSLPSSFTSTWKNLKLMEFARKKKL